MSGSTVLASCSDVVKVWSVLGDQTPAFTIRPHTKSVNSIRWNHNNQILVSAGDDGLIVLNHGTTGSPIGVLDSWSAEGVSSREEVHSLCFSSGSRYLASGGSAKLVRLWDMKTKKLVKDFKGHTDVITSVTFSMEDTHIASASRNGDIILHTTTTANAVTTLRTDRPSAVKCVQYSPFKKLILASTREDGEVQIWDVAKTTPDAVFRKHTSASTGVTFSPINKLLFCSVGLDRNIVFYDLGEKVPIKVITAEAPLTCVQFMHDGATICAGTSTG
eukprot:CAMPEP_0184366394 /NCGR_PEP_ID=MMETSP1089-20130417/153604_1 /TAXON_ID=38269 ORGANISM="Gloeochaete wittrockiana, Strain SAG46.84" /NCGR_SAMPLE_ID=MMETSP1089 /ASSEMBLY_ACC=CAM_ASM_000445 /LENGTH=274 /DNA_ID=CAMNT_0026707961 /DNA_START=176 /DNA_END=997 /DNA_ORIENTATION=-